MIRALLLRIQASGNLFEEGLCVKSICQTFINYG